jgi:DNA-binding transcriptional ArsR family regulator
LSGLTRRGQAKRTRTCALEYPERKGGGIAPTVAGQPTVTQQPDAVFYTRSFVFPRTIVNKDDIFTLIDKHEHIETAARALKAIAHPLRLKILCVLGDTEVCVQDIVDAVGTSQSNISQHLAILRDKGVLQTRKEANRVFYRVGDQRTLQLIVLMREVFCSDKPGN